MSWEAGYAYTLLEAERPAGLLLGRDRWLSSRGLGMVSWRAGGQPVDLMEGFEMPRVRMQQIMRAELGCLGRLNVLQYLVRD